MAATAIFAPASAFLYARAMIDTGTGYLRHFKRLLGKRRRMLLITSLVVLLVLTAFQIAAPFLISSSLVRESMERAVAEWTGHDVEIAGTPDIRFWPEPQITLRDITVSRQSDEGTRPLFRVSRLSASFDLLHAVLGEPRFQDFQLVDPEIYVRREADGRLNWADGGLLSRAVREARASGSSGQDLPVGDDAPMGDVAITNGRFEISDVESGRITRFTGIKGSLRWPWLSRSLQITADAEFNGRRLSIEIGSSQPLLLLGGQSGNASASVASDLFRGKFNGLANLATHGFLSGDAQFGVPDLPALTGWLGTSLPGTERVKSLALNTRLVTNEDVLRFENLSLSLNDTKASGIVDLVLNKTRPARLTGTLAFDRMDLSGVLAAIAPRALAVAPPVGALQDRLEIDLRLSAQKAALGPFQLSDAAISVLNTAEQSRIDIADSDFEDGRLTGRIGTAKGGRAGTIAFRLAVQDADFGAVVKGLGLAGPLPAAHGSLELALDVDRPLTPETLRNAKGTVRFRALRGGTLQGVDLSGIRQLALKKPYFPLSEAGSRNLPFDSMDISATLANGSADISEGRITGNEGTLSLSGVLPYASQSLALSASLKPAGEDKASFMAFIGGSWPDPVLWPISQTMPKPSE